MKTESELERIVIDKGSFSKEENRKIFERYFKNWYKYHEPIYKKFGISTQERILDIGCAYGMNLIHFDKSSVGLEFNSKLVKFGRALGLSVVHSNVEEDFGISHKEKFDLVWCTDFLVHLTSPYAFLLEVREFMTPDSLLVIQIPQYTPLVPQKIKKTYQSATHYYTFNYSTLKYLLEAAGYNIVNSSGYIRHLPNSVNSIFDPFLKRFGTNIWFAAKKGNLSHDAKQPTFPKKLKGLFKPK